MSVNETYFCKRRAAAPVTWGVAMDVPVIFTYSPASPRFSTDTPGATICTKASTALQRLFTPWALPTVCPGAAIRGLEAKVLLPVNIRVPTDCQ